MFALIRDTLQVFPESVEIDGNIYTDLWQQSDEQLEAIGIYKMPEQPSYDASSYKLEVDLNTKNWVVVPLTPEEIKENITAEYAKYYKKLSGKYTQYMFLYESIKDNVYLQIQLQQYLVELADYCLKVYNEEISLDSIVDYPEASLEDFSNPIK